MPSKKTQALLCYECKQQKKEVEMANWSGKGWRCNGCHNAEAIFMKERRETDIVMVKTAQDIFYNRWIVDSSLKNFAKKYKLWDWEYFWNIMDDLRKEDTFIKQTILMEEDPLDEDLPEEYYNWDPDLSMPPLERVDWAST